jgi:hypothetical protein
VFLAGLPVPDRLSLDLARILRAQGHHATAATLEYAHETGRRFVALTARDRELILQALADCPFGLAELRDVVRLTAGLVRHAAPVR